jgi:AmmeMemoRadiSam system protein B
MRFSMQLSNVDPSFYSKIESIKIIPIIVGSIYADREKMYGTHLAPYLADPETLFIVSSDFCHW